MQEIENYYGLDKALTEYIQTEHVSLLKRWLSKKFSHALKTDLFEEACSEDRIFKHLKESSIYVTGVDISSNIVKKAKAQICKVDNSLRYNNNNFNFIVSDLRNVALKDNIYDLIVSTSTLDHFAEISLALKEIHRILKPNGSLILTLHNKYNPFFAFNIFILSKLKRYRHLKWEFYTRTQIKALLQTAGFIPMDSAYIVHIFPLIPSLIKVLRYCNHQYAMTIIEKVMSLLRIYSKGEGRFLTAWFIAFLAKKGNK